MEYKIQTKFDFVASKPFPFLIALFQFGIRIQIMAIYIQSDKAAEVLYID